MMSDSRASLCPLCGQPNQCLMAQGSPSADRCWCSDAHIARDVLERIPEDLRGRSCVCRKCAEAKPVSERRKGV